MFLFNSLDASNSENTHIINDISNSVDNVKNKNIIIKNDIFSPKNNVSTNFDTFSDSLNFILNKLNAGRYEIYEKIFDLDIEQKDIDKISKIKLESELLNKAICVLYYVIDYHNFSNKAKLSSFKVYKTLVKRLASYEILLSQMN